MKKNFRTVKTGIIFGILLFSLFAFFVPSASAGPIKIKPLINVTYPRPEENLIPLSGALDIPLQTTFELTGPLASIVEKASLLKGTVIQIELKVVSTEDWCDASITNPLVQLGLDHTEPYQSTLTVTVTENAPAFTQGIVKISATSKEQPSLLFSIAEETVEFDVSFIIGYWSVVSYQMPKGTLMEVGPLDTADFEIEIENIGNGPTYVAIEVIDIPEGDWSINIASSVQLSSSVYGGEGTKKTVHLIVKPPYGFGFHNEREIFKVKFTPYYLGRADLVGQEEIITFNVQNVGLSPGAGYEIPMIVVVLVIIVVIFYLYRWRKK
jgi:hypothetical protein